MTTIEASSRREEFMKNNRHASDVAHLKLWLTKQQHLPSVTDDQLLTFLNSCDNSLEVTKSCIDTYFTVKCASPEFFSNRDPLSEEIKLISRVAHVTTLKAVSPEGYRYVFTRLHDVDTSLYQPEAGIKLLFMVVDAALRDNAMAPGIIMISDMKGFTLTHALKATPAVLKKYVTYLQEAMPVKLKAMHIINVTPLINTIMAIMRPFISKEAMELLHFHCGDQGMEELYKTVPQKILPSDYGGQEDSVQELVKSTQAELVKCRDWFKEGEEHCKVDETKRENKISGDLLGLQGSFKKLDID